MRLPRLQVAQGSIPDRAGIFSPIVNFKNDGSVSLWFVCFGQEVLVSAVRLVLGRLGACGV